MTYNNFYRMKKEKLSCKESMTQEDKDFMKTLVYIFYFLLACLTIGILLGTI